MDIYCVVTGQDEPGKSAESSTRTRSTCMERLGWQKRPTAIYLSPIMIRL
jgi:hypothetical protein